MDDGKLENSKLQAIFTGTVTEALKARVAWGEEFER